MVTVHEGDDRQAGRCLFGQDVWFYIAQRLSLSERELQITQGVFDDKHENLIAQELRISSHTVHTHLERLYHKLRVSSRVELVVRLAECHLQLCQEADSPVPPICHRHASGGCPLYS
jgi:DNA-binding CsgD family transcriptional regulator